ncbi:hypothetical protein SELMODRAFT_409146 [Selaginella moellendorffii]|uniref:PWI domain-containing protein n=1 Tax=Selaginella moellendorffii TaxID=88036 RepID=D8RAI2_SELML|nr:hypothetical protein SELMODRAFT_409146 [Selaginella moellendorffii]
MLPSTWKQPTQRQYSSETGAIRSYKGPYGCESRWQYWLVYGPINCAEYSNESMGLLVYLRRIFRRDGAQKKEVEKGENLPDQKQRQQRKIKIRDRRFLVTKEELIDYWASYDKDLLQEKMKPWICKRVTEFMGAEEASTVDLIVNSISVDPESMRDKLAILDDAKEKLVLKIWRMLIFEIKDGDTDHMLTEFLEKDGDSSSDAELCKTLQRQRILKLVEMIKKKRARDNKDDKQRTTGRKKRRIE